MLVCCGWKFEMVQLHWKTVWKFLKKLKIGTSPVVKWLRNLPCNAGDKSSIPGRGTKIPYVVEQLSWCTANY